MFAQRDPRATLWKWLAGGASRTAKVRDDYWKWFNAAKKKYNITGIPIAVQKQMVALMEGIYASRRNPDAPIGGALIGDNGRMLYPILMQITTDQAAAGAWTQGSIISLASWYIDEGGQYCTPADYPSAGSACDKYPPCSKKGGPYIGRDFFDMVKRWDTRVRDPTYWKNARDSVAAMPPAKSKLFLSAGVAKALAMSVQNTKAISFVSATVLRGMAAKKAKQASDRKAAIGTTAVILGAGAFYLARRFAKKQR